MALSRQVEVTETPAVPARATASPRSSRTINSGWCFHKGELTGRQRTDTETLWEQVSIPHTWNAEDVLSDEPGYYRGPCWYRRTLDLNAREAGGQLYVLFEGANQDTIVYVNGQRAGEHLGGYTAFAINVTPYLSGSTTAVLELRVTNALNPDVPPIAGDLCHFGGIYRNVHLISTAHVHFAVDHYAAPGILLDTPTISSETATLRVRAAVVNAVDTPSQVTVSAVVHDPEGNTVSEFSQRHTTEPCSRTTLTLRSPTIDSPLLWSPQSPHLYRVAVTMADAQTGKVLDTCVQPLGFRWVSADPDHGFMLNGKHCFIKGVGRHQDYDRLGYAVADEIHQRDIDLIHHMGGNLVRGHYPMSQATYERCDRLGVMAWAKIPIMEEIAHTEAFTKNTCTMMRELILQNYNHPSIVIWGSVCEAFGEMDWFWERPQDPTAVKENMEATCRFMQHIEDLTTELDPHRLSANDYHTDPNPQWYHEAGLTRVSPINGWNLYQGWYHADLDNLPAMLDRCRELNDNRTFLLAEFGVGSDTRIHTDTPTIFDFSTEYADLLHQRHLRDVTARDWIAGMCIWTLFDFQVEPRRDAMPHINNKGLLRADRTPKDCYYLYQAHWSDEPMVHIASRDWTQRIAVADIGDTISAPIRVYTNLENVELLHNGQSFGRQRPVDHVATFTAPLTEGENRLEASAEGTSTRRDWCAVDVAFVPTDLRTGFRPGMELAVNVGQSRTFFSDRFTHSRWLPDRPYSKGSFGHVDGRFYRHWRWMTAWEGIREGVDANIRGTDIDPVFQTFLLGLSEYRFDVPSGRYRVHLYFCEPFSEQRRLDSEEHTGASSQGKRVFAVSVNDLVVFDRLDLADRYGDATAVFESVEVDVTGQQGLRVRLTPVDGEPVLSGVRVRRID